MSVHDLPLQITVVAIALSTAFAVVSWRYVERPFRNRRRIAWPTTATVSAGAMALTLAVGVTAFVSDGLPRRFDDSVMKLASARRDITPDGRGCINQRTPDALRRDNMCAVVGAGDTTPSFLLWGDSHAAVLFPAINEAAARSGRSGLMATASGCPPLIGVKSPSGMRKFRCDDFNDAVIRASLADDMIELVIVNARWAFYAHGSTYDVEARRNTVIADEHAQTSDPAENKAVFVRGLRRTLAALRSAGKRIVIVGPTPEIGWTVPRTLAMQQYTGRSWPISPKFADFLERQSFVIPALRNLAAEFGADLVFPHEVLCNKDECAVTRGDQILYSDSNHLSLTGARHIHALFEPVFR
jgi:hypothetical protein